MTYDISKGINILIKRDNIFALLVNQLGFIEKINRPLSFETLLKIIINQQLSNIVANTLFLRLKELVNRTGGFTPSNILNIDPDKIREVGISYSKIDYIKNLSKEFINKPKFIEEWNKLDDEHAKIDIERLKGFGPWSSNIILLFCLGRPNIFPAGDATLIKAYKNIYKKNLDKKLTAIEWSVPYRSILALYFWKWVDNGMNELQK